MAKRHRGISRRTFIKGAAAAGAALTLPPWMGGCVSDNNGASSPPGPADPRELRTLHFDLSAYSSEEIYALSALRSPSDGRALQVHTPQTRSRFKAQSAFLATVPDANLTHYLENVDLPAEALQHVFIRNTTKALTTTDYAIALSFIHIPTSALASLNGQNSQGNGPSLLRNYAKLRAYGVVEVSTLQTLEANSFETLLAMADFVSPLDTATAVAFHHPEMVNLNPSLGARVTQHIQTTPDVASLAQAIAVQGPGSVTPGGWMTMVLVPGYTNSSGGLVYQYELSDTTVRSSGNLVRSSLGKVKNDEALSGTNWHTYTGMTSVSVPQATDGAPTYQLDYGPGSVVHGVGFESLQVTTDAGNTRAVTIPVNNRYLRYLGVYVKYLDANNNVLLPYPLDFTNDLADEYFLRYVPTNTDVFGVPLQGSLAAGTTLQLNVPPEAVTARLIFGSLGVGGLSVGPEVKGAIILTSLIDYGIPGMMLLSGVGLSSSAALSEFTSKSVFLMTLIGAALEVAGDVINSEIANMQIGILGILEQIGSLLGQILLGAVKNAVKNLILDFKALLLTILLAKEAEDSIPVIGIIARVAQVAGTVAAMTETTIESLTTPPIWVNNLNFTMNMRVTVVGDCLNAGGELPELATDFLIVATYGQKTSYKISGQITQEQINDHAITETFFGAPEGGTVKIDAWVYTKDKWVAGYGTSGELVNFPATAGLVNIMLTQCTPPLTALTTYQHYAKTVIGETCAFAENPTSACFQVVPTPPAPTATRFDLDCLSPDAICEPGSITVSETTGHVGYAFRATGQDIPPCSGNDTQIYPTDSLYVFQDIFNTGSTNTVLVPCGFSRKPALVYPLIGPPSGGGNTFFLQPGVDPRTNLPVHHVRQTTVTEGMSNAMFDLNQSTCWGQFTQAQDALVVHPAGYVTGVNRATHKLEILQLDSNGQRPDNMAAQTWVKAGEGTRVGLLGSPVAIGVALDGTLVVLEAGNGRIQAFDLTGNPVNYFNNNPVVTLRSQAEEVTYLDMAVDATGYMYVLYFLGEGGKAADYFLDIYDPDGGYVSTTEGIAAARIAVDFFRNIYTLNYERLGPASGPGSIRPQPSVSIWVPSVQAGSPSCGAPLPGPAPATPTATSNPPIPTPTPPACAITPTPSP